MIRPLEPSLARRMLLALIGAFALLCVVLVSYAYYTSLVGQGSDAQQAVARTARAILKTAEHYQAPAAQRAAVEAIDSLIDSTIVESEPHLRVWMRVWQADGKLLFASRLAEQEFQAFARDNQSMYFMVYIPGETLNIEMLGRFGSGRSSFIWLLTKDIAFYLLIAFPIILLPIWLAVRSGLRPLNRLSDQLARRAADDLSPVGMTLPYQELKPVVAAIDGVFAKLKRKLVQEQAFLHDAAHELKTPLAVIASEAHVLGHAQEGADRVQAKQALLAAVERASHGVSQLLMLARMEAISVQPTAAIDLAALLRERLAHWSNLAVGRGIEISLDAPDHLPLETRLPPWQSIIDNLLDNALRYTPQGSAVEVRLCSQAQQLVLEVLDDGPGIAEALRERVFERFFRVLGNNVTGAGLGLAIVREAAESLGGTVSLHAGDNNRGCRFVVTVRR
ncbi:ATP-binding protein [Chitinimonas sp.]|uniref:ATP-binding protein n=1 Tax=Chitinimonas sp. TaxID=1934313 RepID=UPI0035B09282